MSWIHTVFPISLIHTLTTHANTDTHTTAFSHAPGDSTDIKVFWLAVSQGFTLSNPAWQISTLTQQRTKSKGEASSISLCPNKDGSPYSHILVVWVVQEILWRLSGCWRWWTLWSPMDIYVQWYLVTPFSLFSHKFSSIHNMSVKQNLQDVIEM